MRNFGVLYGFELRKLVKRKLVWISTAILVVSSLIAFLSLLFGDYVVNGVRLDSNYNMVKKDMAFHKAMDGRILDDTLWSEVQEAFGKVDTSQPYFSTEEFSLYAWPYDPIRMMIASYTMIYYEETLQLSDVQTIYEVRQVMLEELWDELYLQEEEKEFWRQQEAKIKKPLVFGNMYGVRVLWNGMYSIGIMGLLVGIVCLSGIFPEEHTRKTDQLILCCKYGRKHIYWAKFWAGITVTLLQIMVCFIVVFVTSLEVYGSDGFSAAFWQTGFGYSYPLNMGEAMLIHYAMILVAAIFTACLVMLLSEILHSSVGVIAIVAGVYMLPLFISIPDYYRVLSQIWSYLPSNFVGEWSVFSSRTLRVFGITLTSWQAVPVIYALLGCGAAFLGRRVFIRYQVRGR